MQPFTAGLSIINRLRPISFTWKQGGARDLGLAAEEVEQIEPLLTFHNEKGEIEGVRYNQLNAVLINAVKEQQAQIERQHILIEEQQRRLARQQDQIKEQQAKTESLKKLICLDHPTAEFCKAGPKNAEDKRGHHE